MLTDTIISWCPNNSESAVRVYNVAKFLRICILVYLSTLSVEENNTWEYIILMYGYGETVLLTNHRIIFFQLIPILYHFLMKMCVDDKSIKASFLHKVIQLLACISVMNYHYGCAVKTFMHEAPMEMHCSGSYVLYGNNPSWPLDN